jgi:NAD(P)-dependent dehydrogenase (short-subunit alcohol dehydrogenase family)
MHPQVSPPPVLPHNVNSHLLTPSNTTPPDHYRNHRVALVTGGGSGIGFEVARQLGLHGAKVRLSLILSPPRSKGHAQGVHILTHAISLVIQVVIMGRRGPFLEKAVAILKQDGVQATCTYDV